MRGKGKGGDGKEVAREQGWKKKERVKRTEGDRKEGQGMEGEKERTCDGDGKKGRKRNRWEREGD